MKKVYTCVITKQAIENIKVYKYSSLPSLNALCSSVVRKSEQSQPRTVVRLPLIQSCLIRGDIELSGQSIFIGKDSLSKKAVNEEYHGTIFNTSNASGIIQFKMPLLGINSKGELFPGFRFFRNTFDY